MKLLHIDTSVTGGSSVSRQLSAALVRELARQVPDLEVIRRDLDADPIPHLDSKVLAAALPASAPDPATRAKADAGVAVLDEFLGADVIVIGAPMYNFSIASQLKAWLDRVIIAGKTFRYSEAGVSGLAGDKKVFIAVSRGGFYAPGTPQAGYDFQEPYLRAIFGFIGITDLEIIRAEGVAIGPEQRAATLKAALASVPSAVAGLALAKSA